MSWYVTRVWLDYNTGSGAHFIELVINDNLSFNDKESDILDFDRLWSTVAMVIVSQSQVVIDDKFYEMGLWYQSHSWLNCCNI